MPESNENRKQTAASVNGLSHEDELLHLRECGMSTPQGEETLLPDENGQKRPHDKRMAPQLVKGSLTPNENGLATASLNGSVPQQEEKLSTLNGNGFPTPNDCRLATPDENGFATQNGNGVSSIDKRVELTYENGLTLHEVKSITTIIHPADELKKMADSSGYDVADLRFAKYMDSVDPVRHLRDEFFYPKMKDLPKVDLSLVKSDDDSVYFCGNSLGLQPKGCERRIKRELEKWSKWGVYGYFMGEMPWTKGDETIDERAAELVGAKKEEVALMNGLTVNLHFLLISFYRPTPKRYKILVENNPFPSDLFAIQSQLELHGYNRDDGIVFMKPREGEQTLRTEDILTKIETEGESIALICFSGVHYVTGQFFDMEKITKAGHAKGCVVGFDLAHAVGNVPLYLHDWNVDFACWCAYKYMNSGAGGIGGIFVHERHARNDYPKLLGWWSHKYSTRFDMGSEIDLSPGAHGYRVSNPPPLSCCMMDASLEIYSKTSLEELRQKSKLLTGYLELLLNKFYTKPNEPYVEIITPNDPEQRGCQLSLSFSCSIAATHKELTKRGVACDMREPNVLRVTPVHLYNSFEDVHRFISMLGEALRASRCLNNRA